MLKKHCRPNSNRKKNMKECDCFEYRPKRVEAPMAVPPASFRHTKFDLGFSDQSGTSAGVGVWFYLA